MDRTPLSIHLTQKHTHTNLPWLVNCFTASATASERSISNSSMFSRTVSSNVACVIRFGCGPVLLLAMMMRWLAFKGGWRTGVDGGSLRARQWKM